MNPKHVKKTPPRPPTPSDVWQKETNIICARSMAKWLKGSVNTQRPINTLTLADMTNLAENCVSAFLVEMTMRASDAPTIKEQEEIAALLSC